MTRKLLLILMATFVFTGCVSNKDSTEETIENESVTSTNNETNNDVQSTTEETQVNGEDTSAKPLVDDTGLYTAFLSNEVEATIDYKADNRNGESFNLEALTKDYIQGEDINFSDIKEADSIKDEDNDGRDDGGSTIFYTYIDCGCDGKSELLLDITPSYFDYMFIIKEIDGKLYIRFTDSSGDTGWSNVSDKGYYSAEGNCGDYRFYDYGFFDCDARFHRYYSKSYYFEGGSFFEDFAKENDILDYTVDSAAFEDIQVEEYVLYDDVESYMDAERLFNYAVIDDSASDGWYDCDKDSGYADGSSIYMQEFYKFGIKPLPRDEIKKKLERRAKDIGLNTDIIPEGDKF